MTAWLLVAVGAAVGAPLRYAVTQLLRDRGATTHAGTLAVNVVGSLVLGLLVGGGVEGEALALVGIGFCGALTTMSTLALEVWDSIIERRTQHAIATLVLHLVLGLGAAWLGWTLTS
ncbi:CrcB family protein [Knoellia sp. S7-12]|uniref:fluoride efflux transporter FluC n=1 Tax=Knoellia sp. S7-12 TaxID=3126698 RepID=UPI003365E376